MEIITGPKKRHYLVVASVFLVTIALIPGMAGCVPDLVKSFAGGHGTEEDPYQITNWHHLNNVRDYLPSHFILMNDLDSTTLGYDELAGPTANGGKGWQPIGTEDDIFSGTFDGQGHEIRDLFINRPDENLIGLFVGVSGAGVVENIGVVDAYVVGEIHTGGLAGGNAGTITNSYATGSVVGNWSVGGLVGGNSGDGTVSYCYFNGSVTGNVYVGCLVGFNSYAVVSNSYSTNSATGGGAVGGLVGVNERGYVINSYSVGSADGVGIIGGLVGANAGNVSESYSKTSVTGNSSVGGLVGGNGGNVTNCYSAGSVAGNDDVGGLVGEDHYGNVTNSLWDTETSAQATSAGGVGKNTTEMQNIITFSGAMWDIIAVANSEERNPAYTWNIVNVLTYPFLSW